MRRSILSGVFAGLCLSLTVPAVAEPKAAPAATQPAKPGAQVPQAFESKVAMNYLLYLPEDYGKDKDKDKKWPLVMFLHGSGERGSDIEQVKLHGPPKLAGQGKAFPFILVSPQCPAGQGWDAPALKALIDDLRGKYAVDADRLYLTGLSMGGFGTWEMATRYPDLFAAVAPVCGGGTPTRAKAMANVPVWAFHGEEDKAVPIRQTEDMVEALKKAGATDVQFSRYPGVGHDSWVKAYNDPKLYEWMLGHKRAEKKE